MLTRISGRAPTLIFTKDFPHYPQKQNEHTLYFVYQATWQQLWLGSVCVVDVIRRSIASRMMPMYMHIVALSRRLTDTRCRDICDLLAASFV
jgi:hypothetical protein